MRASPTSTPPTSTALSVVNELIRETLHPYPQGLHLVTKVSARRAADGSFMLSRPPEDLKAQVYDNLRNLRLEALDVVNLRLGAPDGRPNDDSLAEQLGQCDYAPQLREVVGIGPDTAVTLLITVGDNPERLGSEASFAALCGVRPVERSSGSRQYRRLNRGGDRQANAALHRIVQTRRRVDPRTRDYYERRSKEGKTRRETVRSLKRYAAREVFHLVRPVQPQPSS